MLFVTRFLFMVAGTDGLGIGSAAFLLFVTRFFLVVADLDGLGVRVWVAVTCWVAAVASVPMSGEATSLSSQSVRFLPLKGVMWREEHR